MRCSTPTTTRSPSRLVLALALACALHGCGSSSAAPAAASTISEPDRGELLTGYALLEKTLSDESNLGKLELFKKLTLDAPNAAIGKLMNELSHTSDARGDELGRLRKLAPSVADAPAKRSPMGEAINDIAGELGKSDMLSRNGGFDVRFVLVQAQATRMVSAMASAIARFEPNPDRKTWLLKLAREYEGYRGRLIAYLGGARADAP